MLQNSIGDVLGVVPPRPQFELFQPVRSHYDHDDFQDFDATGIVIGLFYSPSFDAMGHETGWWYVVFWVHNPDVLPEKLPLVAELFQQDLRAV